jgi:hypothetical protein
MVARRPSPSILMPALLMALGLMLVAASASAGRLGAPQPIDVISVSPRPAFEACATAPTRIPFTSQRPHPAVARIVVPEGNATSYGSGTLIDVRDEYGLVVTNWHVVRDGTGEVEVIFPDGFRSKARPLKVDADWDLAALVIWRPRAAPVKLADRAPQPGELLTICGYGSGDYRAATGRCTQYYAPSMDLPQHMVELDVEARQGDSGGPIFNDRGELAGVLFGAGEGTTLGSFHGRVENFLASLAPNIGSGTQGAAAIAHVDAPQTAEEAESFNRSFGARLIAVQGAAENESAHAAAANVESPADARLVRSPHSIDDHWRPVNQTTPATPARGESSPSHSVTSVAMLPEPPLGNVVAVNDFAWLESAKSVLALVGAATILVQALRLVR